MRFFVLFKVKSKHSRKMKTNLTLYTIAFIALFFSSNLILNCESNFLMNIKKKIFKKRLTKFLILISTRTSHNFFFFEISMISFEKSIFSSKIMILFRVDFAFRNLAYKLFSRSRISIIII